LSQPESVFFIKILTIDVLANDTDVDQGDTLSLKSVQIEGTGDQGSVSVVDNQLKFEPGTAFDSLPNGESTEVTVLPTMFESLNVAKVNALSTALFKMLKVGASATASTCRAILLDVISVPSLTSKVKFI
jgi:hypothetical protein